jgi:hypothetical protein
MPISRRIFLAGAGSLLAAAEPTRSRLLLSEAESSRLRELGATTARPRINEYAAAALKAGPWSVTFRRPQGLNVPAGPNDYVSEAPYWFPDPKNPGGPYIRRDGEHNEARFTGNTNDLRSMAAAVLSLGMGAFCLGTPGCVEHGAKVLATWFVDAKTRMNPHLEYGQMIRGVNTGRGAGSIDTQALIHAAQGVVLLELAGKLPSEIFSGVRRWYADYVRWMTTSAHGKSEQQAGNNHATWWTTQVAAYATFTGNAALRQFAWGRFRDYLVPTEIQPDGSCPREEERTRSLHYSSMNLDSFALLCRLAQLDGVDLWHFHTSRGIGVETAFDYLLPYMLKPATWKYKQIDAYDAGTHYFAGLAGVALPSERLLSAYSGIPLADSPWVQFMNLVVRAGQRAKNPRSAG